MALTWTERQPAGASNEDWRAAASDSDGSNLLAGEYNGNLYTSSNGGANWALSKSGAKPWKAIASDSDGSYLIAGEQGGRLYVSSDSGASWTQVFPAGASDELWYAAASNAGGGRFIVGSLEGRLYTSVSDPPSKPTNPAPADVAVDVVLGLVKLNWSAG